MSLLERLQKEKSSEVQEAGSSQKVRKPAAPKVDPFDDLKTRIHTKIIEEINSNSLKDNGAEEQDDTLKQKISDIVEKFLETESTIISKLEKQKLIAEIIDETIGFGPINPFLHDASVSEIMVNGPDKVYVEKKGKLVLSDVTFKDDQHIMRVIEKIVAPLGRRIDES
jgi:pilus assembly protein CpaF